MHLIGKILDSLVFTHSFCKYLHIDRTQFSLEVLKLALAMVRLILVPKLGSLVVLKLA